MPTPPRPSPQADGTPESPNKSQPAKPERADDRPSKAKESDEHLGAKENQVSDTSAPAGPAFKDEPKHG